MYIRQTRRLFIRNLVNLRVSNFVQPEGGLIGTEIQDDQKVSVHLMITIQKVTSNVHSVPRQSRDIY
jgi:hypothetical protein